MMEIREAKIDDSKKIRELAIQLGYPSDLETIEKRLSTLLSDENVMIAVSVINNSVVGWMQANHTISLDSGYHVEIVGLVVSDQVRGRGAGAALVEAAKVWTGVRGCDMVRVRCNLIRTESHKFYIKMGFRQKKEQKVFELGL
ncbi:GNAT family N-acetyltransferase [Sphingobacterium faecale]|uniref:GNAT family N-acetyltransferase n=1 Tax=Sphingobacterium faecale TaxID=2803775 RepID=A0ABS1R0W9_9SPHI|nr:GNAT family N-acetyltransferase [Sphingobacterium faecale]MBL1407692.1 GNAT family N-acetyltransferase [Sphingobacterium faecale]